MRSEVYRRSRRLGGPLLCAAAIVLGSSNAGCQSTTISTSHDSREVVRPSDEIEGRGVDRLRGMTARTAPVDAPPPPPLTLEDEGLVPLDEGEIDERTMVGLEEAIERLSALVGPAPESREPVVSEEARVQAMKEYAAGRAMILAGDATGAEEALEEATWLDPDAGPAWISLGRARLALGKRIEALQALERAVEIGERDPTALDALGRAAMESGEPERAAGFLAAALADPDAIADPGLVYVLYVDLAGALEETGRLLASIEAMRRGLELPSPGAIATSQQVEIETIRRRSPGLWTDAGDNAVRIGRFDLARASYERAALLAEDTSDALTARRAYVALATGHDAEAALALLDHVAMRTGATTFEDRLLVRYLIEHTDLDSTLVEALGDARSTFAPRSRTIAIELALLQSEAMSRQSARRLLRETIDEHGPNGALVSQLLDTHDERGSVEAAIELVQETPLAGDDIVGRLFRQDVDAAALERAITESRADWAPVLEAWLWLARYRPSNAHESLQRASEDVLSTPGVHALRVRIAAMRGRWADVDREIETLASMEGVEAMRAQVRALMWVQRFAAAAELAARRADQPDASADDLILGARLAIGLGQDDRAVGWLQSLLRRDPYDETARDLLITIASTSRPPDREGASQQLRLARELRPEGRLVRWLLANEMLERGFLDRSEPILRSLAEETPGDRRVFDALVTLWVRHAEDGGAVGPELDWIESQIEARPLDVWLTLGKARLLAATGRAEEAEEALALTYDRVPSPEIARARERLLRDALDAPERAEALAMRRLEEGPQSIEATVELGVLLIRQGRFEEAAEHLATGLPAEVGLLVDQSTRLEEALRGAIDEGRLRQDDLLTLLASLGRAGMPIEPNLAIGWLRAAYQAGDATDVVRLLESIDAETARIILTALHEQRVDEGLIGDQPRAQLAYELGGDFWSRDDPDALALYRLALRFDPTHPLAANDLGYFLLEQGGDLDEVDRLLSIALAGEPESASILDSVGWLRYHQGQFEDETGPNGEVREGAITLLKRALARAEATRDEQIQTLEIRRHLGDATWRAGEKDQALTIWRVARDIGVGWMRANRSRIQSPEATARLDEQIASLVNRVVAVERGEAPPVAPMIGESQGSDRASSETSRE